MEARIKRRTDDGIEESGSEKNESGVYGEFEKERATEEVLTMVQDRPAGKTAGHPTGNRGDLLREIVFPMKVWLREY